MITLYRYDPIKNQWWVVRYSSSSEIELQYNTMSTQINDK